MSTTRVLILDVRHVLAPGSLWQQTGQAPVSSDAICVCCGRQEDSQCLHRRSRPLGNFQQQHLIRTRRAEWFNNKVQNKTEMKDAMMYLWWTHLNAIWKIFNSLKRFKISRQLYLNRKWFPWERHWRYILWLSWCCVAEIPTKKRVLPQVSTTSCWQRF